MWRFNPVTGRIDFMSNIMDTNPTPEIRHGIHLIFCADYICYSIERI